MRIRPVPLLAATAALALAGTSLGVASAATPHDRSTPKVTVLAKKLVGPLRVATAADGTVYFTDDFTGTLYSEAPTASKPTVVYQGTKKGGAPEAVSVNGNVVTFALNAGNNASGKIYTITAGGAPTELADIGAYEKKANPDGKFHYGPIGASKSCLSHLPHSIPRPYTGVDETHPYATTTIGTTTYVADAGANAIFAVSSSGTVSTVAALKPVKLRVSEALAREFHAPSCLVGKKFAFEAVPTDIQAGPDGRLYVTSLPGSEQPDGRVLKVNPTSGRVKTVAGGLLGATGVAVTPSGAIYVAQYFAGEIDRIVPGSSKLRTLLKVPFPADVSPSPTGLVATVHAGQGKTPKGQVVAITP